MCRGNETPNANLASGQSLIRITEVYPKSPKFFFSESPKFIQNNRRLFRMAKLVCAAAMEHLTLIWILAKV